MSLSVASHRSILQKDNRDEIRISLTRRRYPRQDNSSGCSVLSTHESTASVVQGKMLRLTRTSFQEAGARRSAKRYPARIIRLSAIRFVLIMELLLT